MAASFQQAIIDVLVEKTIEAAHATGQTKVTLAGGVSANRHLQDALAAACEKEGLTFYRPSSILATDNAAMIGCRAYYMSLAAICRLTFECKTIDSIGPNTTFEIYADIIKLRSGTYGYEITGQ